MLQLRITGDGAFSNLIEALDDFIDGGADDFITSTLVESLQTRTVPLARAMVPVKSGATRDSIAASPGSEPMSAYLFANTPYSQFLEDGTSPHEISPVNAKALHFDDRFAAHVTNPGIAPGKFAFLAPAVEETFEDVMNDVLDAMTAAIEDMTTTGVLSPT